MASFWNQTESLGLHPVTLSFRDRDKEHQYQHFYFLSNMSYFRTGYLMFVGSVVLFGAAEWILFPKEYTTLFAIRFFVSLPLLLVVAPFFLTSSLMQAQQFRGKVQEFLLYVLSVYSGSLGTMGFVLAKHMDSQRILYATLAYVSVILVGYTVFRIRFIYAALHGVLSFVVMLGAIVFLGSPDSFVLVTFIAFGVLVNLFGAFTCYLHDMLSRANFVQGEQLKEEQDRVEGLLLNVFPFEIASRLKQEEKIADSFDSATVLFTDIVGFTVLSQTMPPQKLVDLLNTLFSSFDELVDRYGAEKIKTIGDAYMAAAGIPTMRYDHAEVVASLALDMRDVLKTFNEKYSFELDLRMGIHSGPVVAGVIGRSRFLYDLWGDTVNTASRMESHGEKGQIQVSHDSYYLLRDRFKLQPRGDVEVKGKGQMKTWWLLGRKDPNDREVIDGPEG